MQGMQGMQYLAPTQESGNLCAVYSLYCEGEFIEYNLRNIYDAVDRIIVLVNKHPWAGTVAEYPPDNTFKLVNDFPDPDGKIQVVAKDWQDDTHGGQLAQRTAGMKLLDEGDWYWLIDGDDFILPEFVPKIREYTEAASEDCLKIFAYTLWQNFHTVGWCEWFPRLFRVHEGAHFVEPNTVAHKSGQRYTDAKIPESDVYFLHPGYARSDSRMRTKLGIYGERSKSDQKFYRGLDPDEWWNNTWVRWRENPAKVTRSVHPVPEYRGRMRDGAGPFPLPNGIVIPQVLKDHPFYVKPGDRSVSVVVTTYHSSRPLKRMLETFVQTVDTDNTPIELIWNDNASADVDISGRLFAKAAEMMGCKLIEFRNDRNLMFTKAANQGARAASGRHVLLLNPDCEFNEVGWLGKMVDDLHSYPNGGICGCKMVHSDGSIHHAGGYIQGGITNYDPSDGLHGDVKFYHIGRNELDLGQYDRKTTVEWVTGACFLIKREVLTALGEMDERQIHYGSDNRYCLAAWKAGFSIVYSPAEVIHDAGKSVQEALKPEEV